jgi:ankyrin repeat protein
LSSELDPLDLSFFNKDKSRIEVKNFANRISLIKTIVQANSKDNDVLLNNAKKLKLKILAYSSNRNMTVVKDISEETIAAIEEGNLETLNKNISNLNINNCYDFDFDGDPLNYLAIAIYYKSMPSLQFFVEKGADIENICENKTPLMFAVKYGQLEMVKYLLDEGAKLETISNEGKTVFDYAKKYGHPEIEKYLKDLLNK